MRIYGTVGQFCASYGGDDRFLRRFFIECIGRCFFVFFVTFFSNLDVRI